MATHVISTPPVGSNRDNEMIAVYVWQLPVRLVHWVMVLAIASLTFTGYYMHAPFLEAHGSRVWIMGTVRFIHEVSGFTLFAAMIVRAYWFFAGNQWSTWRAYIPLTEGQWTGVRSMVSYYSFRRSNPIPGVGHNPMAALMYLIIYGLIGLEILSGMILYMYVVGNRTLIFFLGWITRLIDIQWIRTGHFIIMFLLVGFLFQHIYSALIVSMEEKDGLMESIFTGWKFVSRKLLADETGEPTKGNKQ